MARATIALLDLEYPHEAAIVGRSILEDSLRLGVLAASDSTTRTGLLAAWMVASMTQAERMLREGERGGRFDPKEREAVVNKRRATIEQLARQYGVTGKWPRFDTEAEMARRLGRRDELHAYLFASQVTHGAEVSYFFDPDPVGDRETAGAISAPTHEVAAAALSLSTIGLLRGHIAAAEILGWPGKDEAEGLLDRPLV